MEKLTFNNKKSSIKRLVHDLNAAFSCNDVEELELIQMDICSNLNDILEWIDEW